LLVLPTLILSPPPIIPPHVISRLVLTPLILRLFDLLPLVFTPLAAHSPAVRPPPTRLHLALGVSFSKISERKTRGGVGEDQGESI